MEVYLKKYQYAIRHKRMGGGISQRKCAGYKEKRTEDRTPKTLIIREPSWGKQCKCLRSGAIAEKCVVIKDKLKEV